MGSVSEMMLEMKYGDLYIHDYIKCPCGKGKVRIDKDNTPGFRSRDIMCLCDECNEKYYVTDKHVDDNDLHLDRDGYYYKYTYGGHGKHYHYYYRPKNAKPVAKKE